MNALTIDVEDYFQVEAFSTVINPRDCNNYPLRVRENTKKVLDLLDQYETKATFFCLGWVAERCPDLIKEIAAKGHEIASHGYAHQPVYRQSPKTFREDVRKTKQILEDLTGNSVCGYRAPTYSITKKTLWALEILAEEGYQYDASIFPIKHDLYGIPDAPRFSFEVNTLARWDVNRCQRFLEFPATTLRIFNLNIPIAGGGYFRLFPYSFIKKALRYINTKEKQPFIFYLHPWELDPDQPRIKHAPWRSRFRHYVNLDKTKRKFQRLLKDFEFAPISKNLEKLHLD